MDRVIVDFTKAEIGKLVPPHHDGHWEGELVRTRRTQDKKPGVGILIFVKDETKLQQFLDECCGGIDLEKIPWEGTAK